jgi:hypothetical protein
LLRCSAAAEELSSRRGSSNKLGMECVEGSAVSPASFSSELLSNFAQPYPAPLGVRTPSRLDRLFDQQAVAEGRPNRSLCLDRLEEVARLDDDLVVVARAVARPEAKR